MNTQKHTPGPWEWTGVFIEHGGDAVASLHVMDGFKEMEANARLIAAAPDMYEALRSAPLPSTLGNVKTHYEEFYRWYDKVCKPAIARAEGRTP